MERIHAERIARVRTALESCGLTQMIVCDPKSVWYLTGVAVEPYERLLALYLPVAGEPTLFLNKLFNVSNPPCQAIWHTDTDAPVEQIAVVVDAGKPLGIDKEWSARFLIPLMEAHPAMPVKLASDCVDNCRACKDEAEQELMRTASHINDLVNEEAKHYVKAGMTERQVAEFIDARFRAHGCEGPSFTTIVSFGANAAARDLITEAGYGEYFNHRLGHFIGQTDHEKGDVSSANRTEVRPGMIFSIEPGVYLPGEFGVRVEDLVLVTETGCEVLNHNDKHWDVVGK